MRTSTLFALLAIGSVAFGSIPAATYADPLDPFGGETSSTLSFPTLSSAPASDASMMSMPSTESSSSAISISTSSSEGSTSSTGTAALLYCDLACQQISMDITTEDNNLKDEVKALKEKWEAGKPPFKTDKESFKPTVEFKEGGFISLRNRAAVVTKGTYNKLEVEVGWSWTTSVTGADALTYPDHLTIGLCSDGTQRDTRSWELKSGYTVKLIKDTVYIHEWTEGNNEPPVIDKKKLDITGATIGFDQNKPFTIKVILRDDSNDNTKYFLDVYVWPSGETAPTTPTLSVKVTKATCADKKVLIYNREPVATVDHQSDVSPAIQSK